MNMKEKLFKLFSFQEFVRDSELLDMKSSAEGENLGLLNDTQLNLATGGKGYKDYNGVFVDHYYAFFSDKSKLIKVKTITNLSGNIQVVYDELCLSNNSMQVTKPNCSISIEEFKNKFGEEIIL